MKRKSDLSRLYETYRIITYPDDIGGNFVLKTITLKRPEVILNIGGGNKVVEIIQCIPECCRNCSGAIKRSLEQEAETISTFDSCKIKIELIYE